ncbi:cation diffusion facilitator family transporter [Chlorobium phaeovibrioides]|uniref:cation diffusion facilitator family transporter n=1 Tax=Chlorobium phaeovibrioides TaxID=1094 RepID=UPI0012307A79|nr:cation diffusion facilitator family transporter [Chlorobium phaeovibrioides]QEQ56698.1 cation transporter [Chlorobium phaeovibrioides]
MHAIARSKKSLKPFVLLSIIAAIVTIVMKMLAWRLTGSVGLLSDALESFVNLVGAMMALAMITLAERPADDSHPFGHGKAEYFSSGFEGLLIFIAALSIGFSAVDRLLHPRDLEIVGFALMVSAGASMVNYFTARTLLNVGRREHSITLEADAHHLMTDVWTSVGVIAGVALAWWSGWTWLDPVIALAVAINILRTGWHLLQRTAEGMMDASLPSDQLADIHTALKNISMDGVSCHNLKTRMGGSIVFITLDVMVPGNWSVQQGHDCCESIEAHLQKMLPHTHVTTHLEPSDQ